MNVLSLFDGISCGRIALERSGLHISRYYSSEIDTFALKISQNHYPDCIRLGDITHWPAWQIDWKSIDLVIGGSPCQGLSLARKGLGFKDPRSYLFFVFLDILKYIQQHNPDVKFLLENVAMHRSYLDCISHLLCVSPISINSARVSAQHRVRHYWCNWSVPQPKDRGLVIQDIMDQESNPNWQFHPVQPAKSAADIIQHASSFTRKAFKPVLVGRTDRKGHDIDKRVYSVYGKSPTLTAFSGGGKEKKIALPADESGAFYWRKVNLLECERLQTLPDGYTEGVSTKQRYKVIGNGWTVEVIRHLFETMSNQHTTTGTQSHIQMPLFPYELTQSKLNESLHNY